MKKVLIFSSIIVFSLSISCKKEGCTDTDSISYDSDAKTDNGTCLYEGSVIFWYGENTATNLVADGATSLTFYVDGDIIGSTATNIYWTSQPGCDDNGSITKTMDLGSVKNKSYSYSIKDQTDFEYWSGIVNFTANTCLATEMTW